MEHAAADMSRRRVQRLTAETERAGAETASLRERLRMMQGVVGRARRGDRVRVVDVNDPTYGFEGACCVLRVVVVVVVVVVVCVCAGGGCQ